MLVKFLNHHLISAKKSLSLSFQLMLFKFLILNFSKTQLYLRQFKTILKLSEEIITLFTGQMDTASNRMSFLLNPSLKQQLEYLKVQVKFEHMQKLHKKFDGMKDELIEDVQERIEVFGSVYQLWDLERDLT